MMNLAVGCQYTLAEPFCQKQQQVNLTFYLVSKSCKLKVLIRGSQRDAVCLG